MLTERDRELINYRPILEYIKAEINSFNNIYVRYSSAPWISITGDNAPSNVLYEAKRAVLNIRQALSRLSPAQTGVDFDSKEHIRSINADTNSEYAGLLNIALMDIINLINFYIKTIYGILGYDPYKVPTIELHSDMVAKERELASMITEYKKSIDDNYTEIKDIKQNVTSLKDPKLIATYQKRSELKKRFKELKGYQNTIIDINQVVRAGISGNNELAAIINDSLDSPRDYYDYLYSTLVPIQKGTIKDTLLCAKLLIYNSFVTLNNQTRNNYSHLEGTLSVENKASGLAMLSSDAIVHARFTNVHAGDFSSATLPGKLNSILNDGIAHQHNLYTSHISSTSSAYNSGTQLLLVNANVVADKNDLRKMYSIIKYALANVDESQSLYAFIKQKVEEWEDLE